MDRRQIGCLIGVMILLAWVSVTLAETVSEEAKRYMARGIAATEMAKSPEDYDSAIKEFQKAIEIAPNWPDPRYNLGLVQEKSGRLGEAVASLKEYLRLAPNDPDAPKIREQIYKLEYKAEQVLSVPEIIDVLVSFSNESLWKKVKGECISQPFASIRRKDSISVAVPFLYGLEWGPDMRTIRPEKIEGTLFKMQTNTMCGAAAMASSCHFRCLNEIEVVSKTHVRIRQQVSETERSPITPPVKNGMYSCEYRKTASPMTWGDVSR